LLIIYIFYFFEVDDIEPRMICKHYLFWNVIVGEASDTCNININFIKDDDDHRLDNNDGGDNNINNGNRNSSSSNSNKIWGSRCRCVSSTKSVFLASLRS
jgi:hypothetical protein